MSSMRYLTFTDDEQPTYPICLLSSVLDRPAMTDAYFREFDGTHMGAEEVVAISLHQDPTKKKTSAADMKRYIEEELVGVLNDIKAEYLLVADAEYFKVLAGQQKVEAHLGYVLDSPWGDWKVVYVPNHRQIFYDPDKTRAKIVQGISGLLAHRRGNYSVPGTDIIHDAQYPQRLDDIRQCLVRLHQYPELTCDIEGFSLKHYSAGIGTIAFAWDQHNGIAFAVDYQGRNQEGELIPAPDAEAIRLALREFFETYQGKLTFHSIGFDLTVLIYQLFMADILDTTGLLHGLDVMFRSWDCTKLITYLATNSCAGNHLDLKSNSQEFSGNYSLGEDIKDITRVPLPELLQYNLVDCLSTWFVKSKYEPTLDADAQREIYETLFKPAMLDIVQMQLTGMPVNMKRAREVSHQLTSEESRVKAAILASPIVTRFTRDYLDAEHVAKRNAALKKKQIAIGDEPQEFNPNSDLQVRALLFDWLQLPVISLTESKLPSTDGETISALINHAEARGDQPLKEMLENLQLFVIIGTLTSNFMPSILGAVEGPPDENGVTWHYLFGNFNLGGTLSGRLSSSGPNLQNLPSTGKGHKIKLTYAKLIKSCFQAPPGWLFVGADFPSLEDRISALTTKDPNKLKVYTDGYDGHCLRAFAYFGSQMPDIVNTVDSINSIEKKYKPLRDRSKNPTFTLTYKGTWHALVKKYAFTPEQAKEVERLYHELYKVSDDWVEGQLDRAMSDGYITAAFGLRLRTPLLSQVIRGTSRTPFQAEAEGRTAGNALGQSWCLLNSRAWVDFMGDVRQSKHRLDIRPCAQIHDAGYAMIRDDVTVVRYVNDRLPVAMAWQDHDAIRHDEVKLAGAEVEIFYPDWNNPITIPNGASEEEIFAVIDQALAA